MGHTQPLQFILIKTKSGLKFRHSVTLTTSQVRAAARGIDSAETEGSLVTGGSMGRRWGGLCRSWQPLRWVCQVTRKLTESPHTPFLSLGGVVGGIGIHPTRVVPVTATFWQDSVQCWVQLWTRQSVPRPSDTFPPAKCWGDKAEGAESYP